MSDSGIDLTQFYAVFFEEAFEHLENMEQQLLNLDVDNPDDEELNAIFRAAHSIKGGSGTFGFTLVAEFTHVLENLLDKIRKHEMGLTTAMVDCFLACGDATRQQLEAYRDDGEQPNVAHLVTELQGFIQAGESAQVVAPTKINADALPEKTLRIMLQLPEGGMNEPARSSMFGDLLMLGKIEEDPEGAFPNQLRFWLTTQTPPDEVLSLVQFVANSQTVEVNVLTTDEIAAGRTKVGADDYGFFDTPSIVTSAKVDGDGFGFFTDLPNSTPTPAAVSDDSFGFFEAAPGTPAVDDKKVDEGFGFFEAAPGNPVSASKVSPTSDSSGYGFFGEIPTPSPTPVTPVVENTETTSIVKLETKSESKTSAAAKKPASNNADNASIRVGIDKVDQLINLVGEVVITQAMVMAQANRHLDMAQHESFFTRLAELERNTRDLQEAVMSVRMLPISGVFNRFPRMLRDLAAKLGKQMELKMVGEHTELDKGLVELITDPLTHLVRNSLDHGIEMPEIRLANGKSATGTITLSAFHRGGNIIIQVQDDGGGLRRDKLIQKAREKGIPIADDAPDSEVWQLIFAPGFSTAEQVTDISGRGVGMDVVRKNILALNGTIELDSVVGQGTRTTIRLPLTLAIMDGMSIAVGGEIYVVALSSVVESIQLQEGDLKTVSGQGRVIDVRSEYLPVVDLRELFPVADMPERVGQSLVVIVESEGTKLALLVDELVGQQQVVVKSLESNYRKVEGISGATIMGDGRVAMILDVAALIKRSGQTV